MTELPPDSVQPLTTTEWRAWLEANHATSPGVWLVRFKKGHGTGGVGYAEAVEEALCWGWIDSVVRRFDDERTLLRFTPRKRGSVWARSNRERVARLEAEGRLSAVARAGIEAARQDGSWNRLDAAERGDLPEDFTAELARHAAAAENFAAFPPGERQRILGWIAMAKTASTRTRRVAEAALRCAENVRIDDWNRKENER